MKLKNKIPHILAFTFCLTLMMQIAFSQAQLKKADDLFDHLAYSEAITEYENFLKKNPDNFAAKIKLADCYRLTGRSEKAEFWYWKIVQSHEAKPLHKFYYGQALMNNAKYKEARIWIKEYNEKFPLDRRAEFAMKTIDNLPKYFEDTANYFVWKLIINSPNSDFSPVLYNNGMVFASARETKGLVERKHSWTGQPFLNLFYSKGKGNTFLETVPFAQDVQIKYNDGPVCFTPDAKEIYVTRNNVVKTHVYKSDDEIVKLKIYHSKMENGTWKKLEPFQYNNDNFNCAHPYISPDGKKLFFASDMPGGKGGMDIYVCDKDTNGWKQPKNMGDKINTEGNELFPYLHNDGTFLFSSNGQRRAGRAGCILQQNERHRNQRSKKHGLTHQQRG